MSSGPLQPRVYMRKEERNKLAGFMRAERHGDRALRMYMSSWSPALSHFHFHSVDAVVGCSVLFARRWETSDIINIDIQHCRQQYCAETVCPCQPTSLRPSRVNARGRYIMMFYAISRGTLAYGPAAIAKGKGSLLVAASTELLALPEQQPSLIVVTLNHVFWLFSQLY